MNLEVVRFFDDGVTTAGILRINGLPACYTLEDTRRSEKIHGRTRIPEGEYTVTLRAFGGFHTRYTRKFGRMHRGMLWVCDVPNFSAILIHTGNHHRHTKGCLLVGDGSPYYDSEGKLFMGGSTAAYKRIYPPIAEVLEDGGSVRIRYTDSSGESGQSVLA